MTARWHTRGVFEAVLFLSAVLFGTGVQALITGDYGNKPISDRDWPSGTLAIANHKSRLGWWEGPPFGGGKYTFLFRGDAQALNEVLDLLAKINWPQVELHVHGGPHDDFWLVDRGEKKEGENKRDPRIDWSFTVWSPRNFYNLYNDPRSVFSSDRPEFRQAMPPPRIDVYLGGGLVDWKEVKVPAKVRVVGDPGNVLKDQGPRIRLRVYDMLTSKPIQGATVRLVRSGDDGQKEARQQASDGEGAVNFEKLDPGTHELRIEAAGYAQRSLGWEQIGKGDDKVVTAELSREVALVGRALNSKDEPIAGAGVRTFVVLGLDGRGYPQTERSEAKTNAEGRFELKLPTGYVQLSAQAPGLYHSWTPILPVGDRSPAIEPAEPIDIHMVQTATVTLKLINEAKQAVPGQSVHLEPIGNPVGKWSGSATTDAQGAAVIQGVPPGEYQVTDGAYAKRSGKTIRVEEGRAVQAEVHW